MTKCNQCKEIIKTPKYTCGTGYGKNEKGKKICYKCIGENESNDLANAKIGDKFTFYLTQNDDGTNTIMNWPGSLSININYVRQGRHNIAGVRYDCWFTYRGNHFWGVCYGDFTEICHVKRIKEV